MLSAQVQASTEKLPPAGPRTTVAVSSLTRSAGIGTPGAWKIHSIDNRVSTDQQSTDRQNLALDGAGIEDPVAFEEAAGTSSRLHPLQRPKFAELLVYARPSDTVHISEMFRLVRGTGHILDVLDVLHRDRLALRIHDGAFSAMDLTARHPRTGELLEPVDAALDRVPGLVVLAVESGRAPAVAAAASAMARLIGRFRDGGPERASA